MNMRVWFEVPRVMTIGAASLSLASAPPLRAQGPDPLQAPAVREFLAGGLGTLHPAAPPEVRQFGQLVGVWDAAQEMRARDGSWAGVGSALWVWKFALGGVAVQDLWFQSEATLPAYLGSLHHDYVLTALRVWDARASRWNVAWAANGLGLTPGDDFGTAEAAWIGDRMVMRSPPNAAGLQRITFHHITSDTFQWLSEFSTDGGATWQAVMRVTARRVR